MRKRKPITISGLMVLVATWAVCIWALMLMEPYTLGLLRRINHHNAAMRAAGPTDPVAWLSRSIREGREQVAREVDPGRSAALAVQVAQDEEILRLVLKPKRKREPPLWETVCFFTVLLAAFLLGVYLVDRFFRLVKTKLKGQAVLIDTSEV